MLRAVFLSLAVLCATPGVAFQANDYVQQVLATSPAVQNMTWEREANYVHYTRTQVPEGKVVMESVWYPESKLKRYIGPNCDEKMRQELKRFFADDGVYFPLHPFAGPRAEKLPWMDKILRHNEKKNRFQSYSVVTTASRTVYFLGDDKRHLFALKTGTDLLVDRKSFFYQRRYHYAGNFKTDLSEEVIVSQARNDYIDQVDKKLGPDPHISFLPEIASAQLRKRRFLIFPDLGNGFIVRDTRILNDDYYLPAFSIPYVGKRIAQAHGQDFARFWAKHYAYALGRAKAKMLLRYGLQMETPNTQNILLQLDRRTLLPTGKIVFRDLSDSQFVIPVAKHLHDESRSFMSRDAQDKRRYLAPFWTNSVFYFDRAGIKKTTLYHDWHGAHTLGYKQTILEALRIDLEIPKVTPQNRKTFKKYAQRVAKDAKQKFNTTYHEAALTKILLEYLESTEGKEKLEGLSCR